jgi:chorismate mutase
MPSLLVTGPCSAESEEQVLSIARQLKEMKIVSIFRAGIWKPRTRPNTFEGVGVAGLPWLQKVKNEIGIPVMIEVASPHHIDMALKYDIDMFWIGARTTVNPFAVQEIANRLRGTNMSVMVKNPINADLALWIGALERLNEAGINKLAAIHRGFSTSGDSLYRNSPLWEIPIELKRLFPKLPIICDPSHITGKRDLITRVAQAALDIGMHGLMVESHCNPDLALSDAKQQVTPQALNQIIDSLCFKSEFSQDNEYVEDIMMLRSRIDQIDKELIECIAARMGIVERMGLSKFKRKITALQVNRMDEMLNERLNLAKIKNLDEHYINNLFHVIHTESVRIQTEVMNREAEKLKNNVKDTKV